MAWHSRTSAGGDEKKEEDDRSRACGREEGQVNKVISEQAGDDGNISNAEKGGHAVREQSLQRLGRGTKGVIFEVNNVYK